MRLSELRPNLGSRRKRKRVGRGISSGHGKTSGRGTKGQKARESVRGGFEGGQTPLFMRVPKLRGRTKGAMPIGRFRKEYAEVNVGQLERFDPHTEVTPDLLRKERVIKKLGDGLRVLGEGSLTKPLRVKAHHFSASAKAKIEAAGGRIEVIGYGAA